MVVGVVVVLLKRIENGDNDYDNDAHDVNNVYDKTDDNGGNDDDDDDDCTG